MNSPIIESIFSRFKVDTNAVKPIYLQLSDAILISIKQGKLKSGQKLPSSRAIAAFLQINRITVSKAIEELQSQGWLESAVGRGTFVSSHIPEIDPVSVQNKTINKAQKTAGFLINQEMYLQNPYFIPLCL